MAFLEPHFEKIYAGLRGLAGTLFMLHGLQKVFGFLGDPPGDAFVRWAAGGIELVTGALIALGLFAGPAAFLASGTMAVAYFMAHAPEGFWPLQNKGELAILYCWIFLAIAAKGSGIFSVDAARGAGASD